MYGKQEEHYYAKPLMNSSYIRTFHGKSIQKLYIRTNGGNIAFDLPYGILSAF